MARVGLRVIRLGVLVGAIGILVVPLTFLGLGGDVRSPGVYVVAQVVMGGITVLAWRHDWVRSIVNGTAPARVSAWALGITGSVVAVVAVSVPQPNSWLYFLVVAGIFGLLLPAGHALTVAAAAGVGGGLAGLAADLSDVEAATNGVTILLLTLIAHGFGGTMADVVAESAGRARLLATVAESVKSVSTLDPDQVPHRVADATMQLGFDVAMVTDHQDGQYRLVVERSRDGPVFEGSVLPIGPLVDRAVTTRQAVRIDGYLSIPSPHRRLVDHGIDSVVIAPVVVDDEVVALHVGGLRAPEIDAVHVEAFLLLSEVLAQALGNARRYERERAAVAMLGELGRLKDDFLSNVSHELRTPITVILGGLQTLDQRDDRLDAATRGRLMRRALANAESLNATLGALLEFARIERGDVGARVEVVDLVELVNHSMDRLDVVLHGHAVELELADTAPVLAAVGQLDRVVDNLLLNAARHTPEGSTVVVRVVAQASRVRVEVQDDGPGVSDEDLPHLTDRFFRGGHSTTRESRGLGLGLALAQTILEAHGSGLDVWSRPGRGTRFAFDLARARGT